MELLRHLAVDDERFWFRNVVAGEETIGEGDPWKVGPEATAAEVFDLYRRECEHADAIIARTAIDAAPKWWPGDLFGGFRLDNLREVMLHVITETACHAGHLDTTRELIDRRQWSVIA